MGLKYWLRIPARKGTVHSQTRSSGITPRKGKKELRSIGAREIKGISKRKSL
jgi:hypothetical protein